MILNGKKLIAYKLNRLMELVAMMATVAVTVFTLVVFAIAVA